jgi:uncharacterized delta-60 repeat protein
MHSVFNRTAICPGKGRRLGRLLTPNAGTSRGLTAVLLSLLMLTMGIAVCAGPLGQERPQQAAGTLDSSFGTGGIVTTSLTGGGLGQVVMQQPSDGKLIVAGLGAVGLTPSLQNVTSGGVARYNTNGSLDSGFGTGGTVTISNFYAFAGALDQNGKIVLAGTTENSAHTTNFGLIRLNTDGTTDTTFGGGLVSTTFTGGATDCVAFGLAIQSNGQIIAVGGSGITVTTLTAGSIAVARYNTDGSLDSEFGVSGEVAVNVTESTASSVVIQPDGAIVVGGESGGGGSILTFLTRAQFVLARLNPNGTLDTTFGNGGTVQTKIGTGAVAAQLALQSDGKIVAAGIGLAGVLSAIGVARYNTDGSLDSTFGSGGTVATNFDGEFDSGSSVAIQQNGQIVVAGMSTPTSAITDHLSPESHVSPANLSVVAGLFLLGPGSKMVVARYNTDGTLDTSFGTEGVVTTAVDAGAGAFSTLIQTDGNIVVAGAALESSSGPEAFALARYEAEAPGEFSLQANESTQTVNAGSVADFTIDVQTLAGSTPPSGQVALTAAVSPSGTGITTSFNPASVSTGDSSTLSVTVPSTTAPNTYTVAITGTAGTVTETTSVTVTVSGPDFSLGFSSPTINGSLGTKLPITVEINRTGGLTGKVKVTGPTSLPTGVILKGTGVVTTKGDSATFTLKIKSSAVAGSTTLEFTGTDKAGQTHTATVTLVIQ